MVVSANNAQYALLILATCLLITSTLMFHYSFNGSMVETFFLVSVLITSLFGIIANVFFWINPHNSEILLIYFNINLHDSIRFFLSDKQCATQSHVDCELQSVLVSNFMDTHSSVCHSARDWQ